MSHPRTTTLSRSDIDFDKQYALYESSKDTRCIRAREEKKLFEVVVKGKYIGSSKLFWGAIELRNEAEK